VNSVAGDDLTLAAMDDRHRRRHARPAAQQAWGAAARDGRLLRRREAAASMRTAPSRVNGSLKLPSPSATRSGNPSTRPQDRHSATMSSLSLDA
jgi:hypothetical protein